MTPERYQKAGHLYHAALEIEPASRAAFLDEACGEDEELRRETESLLLAHDKVGNYFGTPALEVAAGLLGGQQHLSLMGHSLSHYRVLSLIGAGGMGEVYLAEDTRLGRKVALKLLPKEYTEDPDRVRRFELEARAASSLNHPNIVTIFEVGQVDGRHFIATEYIEGQTLRERLSGAQLELGEAIDVAAQVSSALEAAHEAGIVHRDIKPENVIVRRDGLVKVLDFGLAKLAERRTLSVGSEAPTVVSAETTPGLVLGTVSYMSPEQARGLKVDARSDNFSLGVVMYEMVAGRCPFEGATASDLMAAILQNEPLPLDRFAQNLPAELERMVAKALRKDRDERYQTAGELSVDLKSLKQELEVEERLNRSPKRDTDNRRITTKSDSKSAVEIVYESGTTTGDVATARSTSSAEYMVGEIKRHKRGAVLALAGVVAAALILFFWLKAPTQRPKVSAYTQITRDSRPKKFLVTDGARVYFTANTVVGGGNYQVSAAGGESIPITNTVPGIVNIIMDISPDGTELLVATTTTYTGEWPLWVQPLLGGSPRRVGDVFAHFAAWSSDGKEIVYGSGSDLLVAKADGNDSRKLTSVDGIPEVPRWSPDGRSVRFTVLNPKDNSRSLWEVGANGTNLHPLLPGWNPSPAECCGNWTEDGQYYFFQSTRNAATNIWAIRERGGFFRTADREPMQITAGPVNFYEPVPSSDGRKLFVIGDLPRGELVRYDTKSDRLVPFMQGLSIEHVDFSGDGEWATYVSYPEGTLWRSRVDGTQRLQLTSSPMRTAGPRWSPNQKRIVFSAALPRQPWKTYLIPVEGGSAQELIPELRNVLDASWSPDGNQLALGFAIEEAGQGIRILDLRTNQTSMLPGSEGLFSPRWSPDGHYISATSSDHQRLRLFDCGTRQWQELANTGVAYPSWSRDAKYIYFGIGLAGGPPGVVRLRVRDRQLEQVASLKNINIAYGIFGQWVGRAPDDSPLMLRYIGTQEIYALDLILP